MSFRKIMMYLMAAFYIGAGINHFLHPAFYEHMIPPYMPSPVALVSISGICELLLGILLFPAATRVLAARLIILMLIVFLPVHVFMLTNYYEQHDHRLWIAIVRLPVQILLIWWAWMYTKRSAV